MHGLTLLIKYPYYHCITQNVGKLIYVDLIMYVRVNYRLIIFHPDYRSVLITESMSTGNYFYLNLPGVCDPRGDVSLRLINMREPDTKGDLFVNFQEESERPIRNRFNMVPFCLAFSVGNVRGSSILMQADDGAPLLTIGPTIDLSIGNSLLSFDASEIDINTRVQRLQICMNGTDAIFYLDCEEVETKPFSLMPSGINFLSILGERNITTLEYKNFFDVSSLVNILTMCMHVVIRVAHRY